MLSVALSIARCAPRATPRLLRTVRHCVTHTTTASKPPLVVPPLASTHPQLDADMTMTEGPSWITIVPQHISRLPRDRSRCLRMAGKFREAHTVLRKAGIPLTHHEDDLMELLCVLLKTDEFTSPRDRLCAMIDALWAAPIRKPKKAFGVLLTACIREASQISDNSSFKREVILKTANTVWSELSLYSSGPDDRAISLMYQICGECKDLELARRIRDQVGQPVLTDTPTNHNETVTAAYLLCLGKCGEAFEAEQLFLSESNSPMRTSNVVLTSLFQAYLASNRISKAESLISMYGSSFLNIQCCNAFVKQCSSLRLFDTAMDFLDRMERTQETSFPPPTARTYNLLLRGLSSSGLCTDVFFMGKILAVVDKMKHYGIEPTTVTFNTLIRSFVTRGMLENALELFSTMAQPNRITFNHLMQGAADKQDLKTANRLLSLMKNLREPPTYGLCKSYLKTVAHVMGIEEAFLRTRDLLGMFGNILILGDVDGKEVLRMALINACGKAGDINAAFRAISMTLGDDRNTYPGSSAPLFVGTVLMQACLDCQKPGQALEVFQSLRSSQLQLNFEVYESLIYGLSTHVRDHIDANLNSGYVGGSEAYDDENEDPEVVRRKGQLSDEERSGNKDEGIKFQSALSTEAGELDAEGIFSMAMELLREMHRSGIAREYRTASYMYNILIAAAASLDRFDLAMEIFRRMTRHSNAKVLYVSGKDMQELIEVGIGSKSKRVREWALLNGCDKLPPATVNTYNSMIAAAWRCRRIEEAMVIYERMQTDRETEPDAATLNLLADIGLCGDASFEVVQTILKVLDRSTLSPRVAKKRVRIRQMVLALRWAG